MEPFHLLVEKYMPLANKLAHQKKRSLPSFINVDELKSAAYMGLVEAATRFNPELGIAFSTYAYPRINGAIHDYLRELGWGKKTDPSQAVSLDASDEDSRYTRGELLEAKEADESEELFDSLTINLDSHAKAVLRCYFIDEHSMREVGEQFHVSESRISQLIKDYKSRIRHCWTDEEVIELAA